MAIERDLIILLAEDNEDDVLLLRRAFSRLNILQKLVAVSDGEEAIPYLCGEANYANREQFPFPDVLVMDARMPRLSGLDVLYWLRTEPRFERLPVVILTGGLLPKEVDMVEKLNASWCLKSGQTQEMPQLLEQAIRHALELTT